MFGPRLRPPTHRIKLAPDASGQTFPGQTPYLIPGMGQSIGSFASVAAAGPNQPATVGGVPTSAAWGGPYNNGLTAGTKKWLFLGEGLWNGSTPLTSATQFISDATFTVYSDSEFHTELTDTVLPCLLNCRAPTVVDAELYNVEADDPGLVTYTFLTSGSSPIIWDGFLFNSFVPLPGGFGAGPVVPATFDTATPNSVEISRLAARYLFLERDRQQSIRNRPRPDHDPRRRCSRADDSIAVECGTVRRQRPNPPRSSPRVTTCHRRWRRSTTARVFSEISGIYFAICKSPL